MGRYYNGDINGKFWFAVQSSEAPSRFGGQIYEPAYIQYHFDEDHLDEVKNEIDAIELKLGENKKVLDDFFKDRNGYTDDELSKIGITKEMLVDYADLGLGIKIKERLEEHGSCEFQAEI